MADRNRPHVSPQDSLWRPDELELLERSKDDRAMIVGSEIRTILYRLVEARAQIQSGANKGTKQ
jgi:hypothetical protein